MDVLDPQSQDAAVLRGIFLLSKLKTFDATQLKNLKIGGKARGLVRLMQLGLNVPPGFVLTQASAACLLEWSRLEEVFSAPALAVRSSMEEEDGSVHSFAGQFESLLDVVGLDAVREAVARCFASVESARSATYRRARVGAALPVAPVAAVIVQRMVPARKAGVLFTVDPVTQLRDRIVIEAVSGLGEGLLGGTRRASVLQVSHAGEILHARCEDPEAALSEAEIGVLVADALRAEAAQGMPLDLEWAIDAQGVVHWLQMRPITALDFDPGEFDTSVVRADAVLTRGNVGEILPGAITPLTLSTTVPAIEWAMSQVFALAKLERPTAAEHRIFKMRLGQLFIDLREMVQLAGVIVGAKEEDLVVPFCGRMLPGIPSVPRAACWKRGPASARFFLALCTVGSRIATFQNRLALDPAPRGLPEASEQWRELDGAQTLLREACAVHLIASIGSGVMHGVLRAWLAWCGLASDVLDRALAGLLCGISEVDEIPDALDAVFAAICANPQAEEQFFRTDINTARHWLQSETAGRAFVSFADFLQRYGHRGEQEFEIRAPSWRLDPTSLVVALQARRAAVRPTGQAASRKEIFPSEIRDSAKFFVFAPLVLRVARAAVRNREKTKSLSVQAVERFKLAYRNLGEALLRRGVLAHAEDVFFLTHAEVGRLVTESWPEAAARVRSRRRAFALQQTLEFADFSVGRPEPRIPSPSEAPCAVDVLHGQTVSRGCVTGRARVAPSLAALAQTRAEIASLGAEEILIVPAIDVGWTPYFGCLAGLATELGSAVSHGAVLAREYGLPAVVNLRNATQIFRTGDWVTLDAERGVLRRATPEEQAAAIGTGAPAE